MGQITGGQAAARPAGASQVTEAQPGGGRVTVMLTSPRVAPGLLTWAGWQVLRSADRVGCAALDQPSAGAVAAAGVELTRVEGDERARWQWLAETASAGGSVVWFAGDDGDPGLIRVLSGELVRQPEPGFGIEVVHASYDVPGARLIDLVRVMDRLRTGCPWDREQTHQSLARYLIEEAYETLEAIETADRDHLREELGDLLLQVVFHSRIAEEHPAGPWSVDDVAGDIVEKLIRRHPHVFADVEVADAAAVEANWESIKAAEKQRDSAVDGIPLALPALALADKVLSRLPAPAEAPTPTPAPALVPVDHSSETPVAVENFGAELLDVVRRARVAGVDAEQALRGAVRELIDRIRAAERAGEPAG